MLTLAAAPPPKRNPCAPPGDTAFAELSDAAQAPGANAVVGIDFEY
ncbi:MAG: hypothetical protein U1E96_06895 [Azonexus sp.]